MAKSDVADRLARVTERIHAACERSGRSPGDVTLVAVTKTVPVHAIQQAIAAGVTHIGENRVQEAGEKFPVLSTSGTAVTRHMIGHLQTNKVRSISDLFDWIHSVDRLGLAEELGKRAVGEGRIFNCLVQVNVSREATKHGVGMDQAEELVARSGHIAGVRIRGLMTMAPHTSDTSTVRQVFASLRSLAESLDTANRPGVSMEHLSMGMSSDYEVAVEEGATMVRVGSAIFGPRE